MPRILFYEAYYDVFYGAQQYMYELVSALDKSSTIVMTPQHGVLLTRIEEAGIRSAVMSYPASLNVYGKKLAKKRVSLKSALALMAYNIRVCRFLQAEKIDLVYCNNQRSVLSAGLAAKVSRRPLVWYVQMSQSFGYIDELCLRQSDKVVTISDDVRKMFSAKQREKYEHKFKTIYPGLNVEPYGLNGISSPRTEENNEFIIGIVATIRPLKGHHLLLEAIRSVLNHLSEATELKLWVVGDSLNHDESYKEELKQQTKEYGLESVVQFLGWRDDVPSLLNQMDLLVLPSTTEGVPKCILEAMASRKPVVATDVGGVSELVAHDVTGLIVPPNNVDALHDALLDLMRNEEKARAMGIQGRQRVEQKFTSERFVGAFNDLFLSMMK